MYTAILPFYSTTVDYGALSLTHTKTHEENTWEAPLPDDMMALLAMLQTLPHD